MADNILEILAETARERVAEDKKRIPMNYRGGLSLFKNSKRI